MVENRKAVAESMLAWHAVSPLSFINLESKGWRSGEIACLPPIWPGSNLVVNAICGLSLLMVLSLAPRGFSPGPLVFLSLQKLTFPNSNSTKNQVDEEPLCGCATSKSLLLLLLLKLTN